MMKFEVKFDVVDLSEAAQDGFIEDVISREVETVTAADMDAALKAIELKYADVDNEIGVYFNECNWIGDV